MQYRVDDLARAAGVTVRNVRAYQERGLLPPPRRQGRVSLYDEGHLARLRLIDQLHGRGYTTAHIAGFLAAWEGGRDLGSALGLEDALVGPGSDEIPGTIPRAALADWFGVQDPIQIQRALDLGLIAPAGDDAWQLPNPRLVRAGAELARLGVPLGEILDLAEDLRGHVRAVADRFVRTVADRLLGGHDPGWLPSEEELPRLAQVVAQLRPLGRVVVDTELAAALDAGIEEAISSHVAAAVGRAAGSGPDAPTPPAHRHAG